MSAIPGTLPLSGRVAVVAGATRGAGRGIARALGEAGAVVYCTGRSVSGAPSAYGRPETIDETADRVRAAGGEGVAVRVDHTDEEQVRALFERVERERGRLDVLADCVAGEDPMMAQWATFWKTDLANGEAICRQSILSHFITAKHAAPRLIAARQGLIVEVTEGDALGAGGNPLTQMVKLTLKAFALNMAAELKPFGVAAIAITPGFLRSESMLERQQVTASTWQSAKDPNFRAASESPLFVGRAVAALAADPRVLARTGQLTSSWELSRAYGFTDEDGRRPDWGSHAIDFSVLPPAIVARFRTATELQRGWLHELADRTDALLSRMPTEQP